MNPNKKQPDISASPVLSSKRDRELTDFVSKKYSENPGISEPRLDLFTQLDTDDIDKGVWSKINFDMRPDELSAYLDQYIVRQEEAKAVLATKVCTHFKRAKYLSKRPSADPADGVGLIKNNVLMIGPTGVGKTYMVKLIAAKLGVPFVKGDATKFSETGYVGGDVEDLIRDLVHEAGDDIELAEYGIVYVDEIDKIASSRSLIGPDVSRTGVQRALLKPMEETEVDLKTPHDPISQIQAIEKFRKTGEREKRTVNTRHILFIMSGAFNELGEVIKRRLNTKAMGFGAEVKDPASNQEYLKRLTPQDLAEFGFENEFIGRLPVMVQLEELEANDLYEILINPNNPVIISKKRDFAAYDIDLRFEQQALRNLAARAAEAKTGARALVSVLERALLPFEKKLPATNIKRLLVTPELVADPTAELEKVLADPLAVEQAKRFQEAVKGERVQLLKMIARREHLYAERLDTPLTPARMDLIADEYYRAGMTMGAAFDRVLDKLGEVRRFEDNFYQRYSLEISFGEPAEVAVLRLAAQESAEVTDYLWRLAQILEPGLRLMRERIGQSSFELPAEAVMRTEDYLHNLFKSNYRPDAEADGE
jgi:ATP-dependent Clp protease ATP-binding subunit ClpX